MRFAQDVVLRGAENYQYRTLWHLILDTIAENYKFVALRPNHLSLVWVASGAFGCGGSLLPSARTVTASIPVTLATVRGGVDISDEG